MRHRALFACCAAGAALLASGASARADTLGEALIDAYTGNPQILSERANLRAIDEGVSQALSGWRPTVTVTGSGGWQHLENKPALGIAQYYSNPYTADVNVTQPIYPARVPPLTAQAEKNVESERARNIATEGTVFFSVIQAYLDVVRDQATLDLSTN